MSDSGPFGQGAEGNPFEGQPLFGPIGRMLGGQGPVSWEAARQFAYSIAADGGTEPNVDPAARIHLEELARVAELQVTDATGLLATADGGGVRVVGVTRTEWARATLDAYKPWFEVLAGSLAHGAGDVDHSADLDGLRPDDPMGFLAPLMQMMAPMMLGMTAGSMVGQLALRSFGPYSLPLPRSGDEIPVVVANLDQFGADWSLQTDDLRLWVCVHEVTHHAVLRLPHVRARVEGLLRRYLSEFQTDPTALETRLGQLELGGGDPMQGLQHVFDDPEVLLGAIQSPQQRALLPELEALAAALVGYVDQVLERVGGRMLTSNQQVTEALRRRRVEADPADRFVERLFGLELGQTTYDRGQAFVSGVLERAGDEGLARLWHSDRELPTPAEIDAPGLWLARIDLPRD